MNLRCSLLFYLLFLTLCSLPLTAQNLSVSVSNIPANATRLVALVDGGGLGNPLQARQDVAADAGTATMNIGVPAGGPYRIRVIAFRAGGTFPAISRSGKATGASVASGSSASTRLPSATSLRVWIHRLPVRAAQEAR